MFYTNTCSPVKGSVPIPSQGYRLSKSMLFFDLLDRFIAALRRGWRNRESGEEEPQLQYDQWRRIEHVGPVPDETARHDPLR